MVRRSLIRTKRCEGFRSAKGAPPVTDDRRFPPSAFRSRAVRLGVLLGVISLGLTAAPTIAQSNRAAAPSPGVVDGSYIVTLEPGNDPPQVAPAMAAEYGGRAPHVYQRALPGFSFEGSK